MNCLLDSIRMIILGLVYIGQGHGTSVSSVRWFDITYEVDHLLHFQWPSQFIWCFHLCIYVSPQVTER